MDRIGASEASGKGSIPFEDVFQRSNMPLTTHITHISMSIHTDSNIKVVPASQVQTYPKFDFSKIFESTYDIKQLPKTPQYRNNRTYLVQRHITKLLQTQPDTYFVSELGVFGLEKGSWRIGLPLSSKDQYEGDISKVRNYAISSDFFYIDRAAIRPSESEMAKTFDKLGLDLSSVRRYGGRNPFHEWAHALRASFFVKFSEARQERKNVILENLKKQNPEFLALQTATSSIEKTNASLAVVSKLTQLYNVIGDIITGVQKGTVSEGTLRNYVYLMADMGRDKRDIINPVKKHFIAKKSKSK